MIALISIAASGFVFARDLQVNYPQNGPTTTDIGLKGYINYIYKFFMGLAGVIAFGALVFAGFQYLTSAGNPQAMTNAKNQMTGAIIGLLLLLGSHILLSTINPRLVNLEPAALKPKSGVCLHNSSDDFICYTSGTKKLPDGFEPEEIEFISSRFNESDGGNTYQGSNNIRGVYTFNDEDWQASGGGTNYDAYINNNKSKPGDSNYVTGTGISNSTESFYIEWGESGIYLYKEPYNGSDPTMDFPNKPYLVHQSSVSELSNEYNNEVSAVQFRPFKCLDTSAGNCPQNRYGAIFHTKSDQEGECSIAYGGNPPSAGPGGISYCAQSVIDDLGSGTANSLSGAPPAYLHEVANNSISSMTVFNHACHGNNSGEVIFYEQTARSGDYFELTASDIEGYLQIDNINYTLSGSINYSGKGGLGGGSVSIEDGDDTLTDSEMDEIKSMKVEGNFLVVLTRSSNFGGHCQTNKNSVTTFNGKYVLRGSDYAKIKSIAIIPLQE